ncbi:MAG: hypothetical protein IJB19_06890 [Clostridia bacterium]|nr:hypothetical protein [Clostridia bacterium]
MKRTLCLLLACLMVLPLFASCDKETGTNPQTTTANTAQTTEATTVDPDKPNIPSAEEIGDISGDFHILVSGNWAWNDYASEGEEGTVIESAIYKRNQNMYENYGINITTEDVAAYQTAMGNGTGYKKVYTAYMSGDDIYNATMIGAYDVATLTYNGSLRIRLLHYSVLERERRIFGYREHHDRRHRIGFRPARFCNLCKGQ